MNIFILSRSPRRAAQMCCDKHVCKMVVETAQMLCYALHRHEAPDVPYKLNPLHSKHPCTLWCGETKANFMWLVRHGVHLAKEYTYRYKRTHRSEEVILFAKRNLKHIPSGSLTSFPQAMPEEYKQENAVHAYRSYYKGEKLGFAKWTRRSPPSWLTTQSM